VFGLLADDPLDRVQGPAIVVNGGRVGGDGAFERLEVGEHVADGGTPRMNDAHFGLC
jgi:hypothetical protein